MASEYGLEILNKVQKRFATLYANDKKIKTLTKAAQDSTSYEIANEYAIRTGELLSTALKTYVNSGELSYISEELAEDILRPTLTTDHELIADVVKTIQLNQNKVSGIGIAPQVADLDTNRIDGLIKKISSYETMAQGEWLLEEPVINYSQAVVDDTMRKNMDTYTKVGMEPTITRVAEPGACPWCRALTGVYAYSDTKKDDSNVYRRHEYCRCIITYKNGNKRQDVRSKAVWFSDDENERKEAIQNVMRNKAQEEKVKNIDRQERLDIVSRMVQELGFTPKGASIAYNMYREDFRKYGLERVLKAMSNSRFDNFR